MVAGHYGTSCHSGTAGPCLIFHSSLIGPYKKSPVWQILYKVHISTFWKIFRHITQTTPLSYYIVMFEVFHTLHIVRRTRVQKPSVKHLTHISHRNVAHSKLHNTCAPSLVPSEYFRIMRAVISQEM